MTYSLIYFSPGYVFYSFLFYIQCVLEDLIYHDIFDLMPILREFHRNYRLANGRVHTSETLCVSGKWSERGNSGQRVYIHPLDIHYSSGLFLVHKPKYDNNK